MSTLAPDDPSPTPAPAPTRRAQRAPCDIPGALVRAWVHKADDGTERVRATFTASTDAVDRMDDIVDQSSWRLANYQANPVILWAHRYDVLPVGKATRIGVEEGALVVEVEFSVLHEDARVVGAMVQAGELSAVSVGFRPGSSVPRSSLPEDDPRHGKWGYVFMSNELLEISVVPVPANAEALAAKGLPEPATDHYETHQRWTEATVRRIMAEQGAATPKDPPKPTEGEPATKGAGTPAPRGALEARATLRAGVLDLLADDPEVRSIVGRIAEAAAWAVPDDDAPGADDAQEDAEHDWWGE